MPPDAFQLFTGTVFALRMRHGKSEAPHFAQQYSGARRLRRLGTTSLSTATQHPAPREPNVLDFPGGSVQQHRYRMLVRIAPLHFRSINRE